MEELGITPDTLGRMVLTHLHWDHTGTVGAFPAAQILVHERELEFWGSEMGSRLQFAVHAEAGDIDRVLQAEREGRVVRLGSEAEVAPGVRSQLVGGHSPGQIILLVDTASGPVVLASDAIHYYEEMERDWPCSIVVDVPETYAGYELLRELGADDRTRIVAGHDPLVLERFPRLDGELAEHAVCLR
jgi:glyoxylase-like metal-dependent hydrolase (beta-lactamase superfamily II)